MSLNQHIKYADLTQKGYLILDLTEQAAQSDWFYVSNVTNASYTGTTWGTGWLTNDGDNHLTAATAAAQAGIYPPLAPTSNPDSSVGISDIVNEPIIISAYPNPFVEKFVVQFNLFDKGNVQIRLTDVSGKIVLMQDFGQMPNGLHYLEVNVPSQLASGLYIFTLHSGENVINRRMSKLE
jgi:hypothetical protein